VGVGDEDGSGSDDLVPPGCVERWRNRAQQEQARRWWQDGVVTRRSRAHGGGTVDRHPSEEEPFAQFGDAKGGKW